MNTNKTRGEWYEKIQQIDNVGFMFQYDVCFFCRL